MFRMFLAALVLFLASPALHGQSNEPPLTPVDFEKLRLRALDEPKTVQLPPKARTAMGLPDVRMVFKQIAAGDDKRQYFFLVRTGAGVDDVCISIREEGQMRIYLTNSKRVYRGGATGRSGGASTSNTEQIRAIPSGDPKALAEFADLLGIWSQVAQSLP